MEGGVIHWVAKTEIMRGGEIFGDDEISVGNFRYPPNIGGGILLPNGAARKMQRAQLWQISSKMRCSSVPQVPTTGSCSQFCLFLHSHRDAVFHPKTFKIWVNK